MVDGTVYSKWSPYAGVVVETRIVPTDNGHIRRHRVTCEENCVAFDCGFTIPRDMEHAAEDRYGSITGSGQGTEVLINCKPNASLMFPETMMKCVKYVFPEKTTEVETVVVYPTV